MKRSKFNLGHYRLCTCNLGELIPITWFEVLPGDTVQHATHGLIRAAPLVAPTMHPVQIRFHHFFVPNRLIWANWQNFITGGPTGMDASQHPYITISASVADGSLNDYLGIPTNAPFTAAYFNALPLRAYNLIWNEYFRDEDLETALTVSTGDGNDTTTTNVLQHCDWEKDYLTTCRPWTSKGPGVSVPLQGKAALAGFGIIDTGGAAVTAGYYNAEGQHVTSVSAFPAGTLVAQASTGNSPPSTTNYPNMYADLGVTLGGSSPATGIDPLALRHALGIERYQEARARYGSRYTEYLRYLGVTSSDARLQRPELLGSGRQTMQFSEIMQTGVTSSGTGGGAGGVGQFGGHGIAGVRSNRYRRFFEEHGIVMSLMSIRPRTMYSERVPRQLLRGIQVGGTPYAGFTGTKEDYWQRELQHIGQQGVNVVEADGKATVVSLPGTIFGYQDRYDEYRRAESTVHGAFRDTLDTWHLAREFGSAPALNATFVSCQPRNNIFNNTAATQFYCYINHSIQARRLVAKSGAASFAR